MSPFTIEHSGRGHQPRVDGHCLDRRVLERGEDPLATSECPGSAASFEFKGSAVIPSVCSSPDLRGLRNEQVQP
jgi:hypothetical protein